MKSAFWIASALALGVGIGSAHAQDKQVTIVHQDMVVPFRALIDSKKLEEATGYTINWQKIPGGGDVIRAMASGDAQIGEVGSSPAAAAVSSGIDVQVFWILDDIANAEQLVAREGSGVETVADLKGKKIGVPFVSTTHYQLLFALQDAGLSPTDAEVLNMAPPAIAAAWERGDIDATFVWDPVLSQVKKNGKVIVSAGELAQKGRPTFDAIVVDRSWAAENKEFMTTLVKMIAEQDEAFRNNKDKWTADSAEVQSVAKISGADPASVPNAINAYKFLTLEEQASEAWLGGGANGGVAKALADTAAFLKEQGRITEVADDYSQFVTDEFVKAAQQ